MRKLTPERVAARREYHEMLNQAHINGWSDKMPCHERPDLFTDMERAVSQDEAAALCAGCPMLTVHREAVLAFPPKWGVAGGISWDRGMQYEGKGRSKD